MSSKTLGRELLNAADLPVETVDVPEWGGSVCIKTMSGAERDAYATEIQERMKRDGGLASAGLRAMLLVRTLCDENKCLVFTPEDEDELNSKSGVVLERLFDVASRLNGIGSKALKENVADFKQGASGSSGSASPGSSEGAR